MTIRDPRALAVGILLVLTQVSGCARVPSPTTEPSRVETPPQREALPAPAAPPAVEQPQQKSEPKSVEAAPQPAEPAPKAAEPAPPTPQQPKVTEQPKATDPPKPAEPSQPGAAEPQPKPAAPAPAKPPQPPRSAVTPPAPQPRAAIVDLTSLEKRLRDTSAIGVFTKLSLKNEVDDLLDRFRTYHAGRGGASLAKLRESYDLLVLKVVSLLQDRDAALARDISTSREALWSLLADPAKFKTL